MTKKFTLLHLLLFSFLTLSSQGVSENNQDDKKKKRVAAKVAFVDGKLTFESEDKAFKLWFDNRVYIDAAYYMPTYDITGMQTDGNGDMEDEMFYSGVADDQVFKFSSGVIVRRARFGIKATLHDKWFAELDVDFGYNEIEMKDMLVGYKFNDHFSIKMGNFKEPMSMERMTSSKYLTTMERPMAVQTLAGGRKLGIAATGWGKHWWASAGLFGAEVYGVQKERNRGYDGWGFSGRVATSPVLRENFTLHIGGYGQWRVPEAYGQSDRWLYLAAFPESYVDRRRFVRAKIGKDGDGGYVDHYSTFGAELAVRTKKILAYGEYIVSSVSRYYNEGEQRVDLKNALMGGWYATISYMIRGEQRRYDAKEAEFSDVRIKKGGNIEIVARVSTLDLNDFSEPLFLIEGGSAISYSAQVNWIVNRNVAFGLNYLFMDNDEYADDKGDVMGPNGETVKEYMPKGIDFGVLQCRIMVSF